MKVMVTTRESFRHSYSREFGWEINENNPERKMISYQVYVDGNYKCAQIEKHFPDQTYYANAWINEQMYSGVFDSMNKAKSFLSKIYSEN